MGHDARQPRARLCRQRHRRRPHPHADAVSDQQRQGYAEQRADADVRARATQSRQSVYFRRGRVRRPEARARCEAVQGCAREEEGGGQRSQGRDDVPGRDARLLDPLLACGRRHRPRQGHRDDRRAPAANGRQHEGRHHGLLLRRRAVERAAEEPEDRLHGGQHGRDLEQAPREELRHARGLGRRASQRDQGVVDGRAGGADVVRRARESRGARADRLGTAVVQLPRARHPAAPPGSVRLRHGQGRRGQPAHHEVLEGQRVLPVPQPRALVPRRGRALGQVQGGRGLERARSRRSIARTCGARPRRSSACRRRRYRSRRRAASRRSSTARCSTPPIPQAYLASLAIKRSS